MTAAPLAASSWPVGSSARISCGAPASTRATATRWACPPEISSGSLSASSDSRRSVERLARASLRGRIGHGRPGSAAAPRSRRRVNGASRLGPWKIIASCDGRRFARLPIAGQETEPVVGSSRPAIRYSSVDLPDPDGPTSAIRWPAWISQSVGAERHGGGRRPGRRCATPARQTASGRGAHRSIRPSRSPISRSAAAGDLAAVGDDQDGRAGSARGRAAARGSALPRSESSSPVGSSARITAGSLASATARPARASSPPDSCGRPARRRGDRSRSARAPPRATRPRSTCRPSAARARRCR